jgi:cytochrome P450
MSGCPHALTRIRSLDPAALRRPGATFREAVADGGTVQWSDDFDAFMVLGSAEAVEVLRRPEVFSSRIARGRGAMEVEDRVRRLAVAAPDMQHLLTRGYGASGDVRAGSTADPPRHTRQRALIAPAFSPRRIGSFEPLARQVTTDLLDALRGREQADLLAEFAQPLPLRVLAVVLGVRPEHIDDYARWSVGILKPVGRPSVEPEELDEMVQCRKDFDRYFAEVVQDRLDHPRDDFMTDFAVGATSGEEPLTLDEMLAMVEQFVIAGHETTTKLLSNAIVVLMERPDLLARLQAEPERLDAFIDEMLRLEGPAQLLHRLAMADTTIGGVAVPAGSAVTVVLPAANLDERTFDHPLDVDLQRSNGRGHFGFGFGAHFCVGHALARLESIVALGMLLERLEFLEFATEGGRDDIDYLKTFALHGPAALPVRYRLRSADPAPVS